MAPQIWVNILLQIASLDHIHIKRYDSLMKIKGKVNLISKIPIKDILVARKEFVFSFFILLWL